MHSEALCIVMLVLLVVPDEFVSVTHYAPLDIMHNHAMHYEIVDCMLEALCKHD